MAMAERQATMAGAHPSSVHTTLPHRHTQPRRFLQARAAVAVIPGGGRPR